MITQDEAKRELKNCIGDYDTCKYHYYELMSAYFYAEPKLRRILHDILLEVEE